MGVTRGGGISNLALVLQICLVPNQHNGEIIPVLDSEDLCEELAHLIETAREVSSMRHHLSRNLPRAQPGPPASPSPLPVVNGKHQQEAVASTHVLLPHGTKFLLPRSVQDCGDRERNVWVPPGCPGHVHKSSESCPLPPFQAQPSHPHCPAVQGCRPQCRSLCRNLQWWDHSQTQSRTGG